MIAIFYFRPEYLEIIIQCLSQLDPVVRPKLFSDTEDMFEDQNKIESERFQSFKNKNPLGFYLQGDEASYDIKITPEHIKILVEFSSSLDIPSIVNFCTTLSQGPLRFGFSCQWEEYLHRNRVNATFGANNVESWVGRDIEKSVPGLYWITLFSKDYATQHQLDTSKIFEASEVMHSSEDKVLCRFFNSPSDWQDNCSRLDDLCLQINGIFSKKVLQSELSSCKNFMDFRKVVSPWR